MLKNRNNQIIISVVAFIALYAVFQQWELIGFSNAEVFGHVWSHSWRFENWPSGLFGTGKTVGTDYFPIIDPIPTLMINLFAWFIPLSSSYNVFLLSSLTLSIVVIRGMAVDSDPITERALLFLLLSSPIIWGSLNSGLTEDWGLFLPILALISIDRKQVVQAGVWVAIAAYWGLVLGWMSAILVSLYAIIQSMGRRDIMKMWMVMGIGVMPLLALHWERLFVGGHRSPTPPDQFDPMWMLNPWHHTDVASLFWVGPIAYSDHIIRLHPASLGIVAMFSSLGCRDWKWWTMFIVCVGFSLGPEIYWMGQSTGIQNPLHWILSLIPGSSLLNHHGRWMLMASICWIIIVVQGMNRFKALHWVTPLIVLEWLLMTPLGFPLMGTETIETSSVLMEMQDERLPDRTKVLRVPVRGPEVVFQKSLYEQTVHGLPLWMNPNRPNPSEWFRLTEHSLWIENIAFTHRLPSEPCVPKGVGLVLVAEPFVGLFINSWDEPAIQDDKYALWKEMPHCLDTP